MARILSGIALAGTLVAGALLPAQAQMYGALPPGSYRLSCTNIVMRGATLSASCTNGNGQRVYSSLNVNRCAGAQVKNSNGYLTCSNFYNGYNYNGYNYNGSYNQNGNYNHGRHRHRHDNDNDRDDEDSYNGNNGYNGYGGYNGQQYGLPGGSYRASCTNIAMNGSMLSASCTNGAGQRVYSSINVNRCASRGTQIRNDNGYLRC